MHTRQALDLVSRYGSLRKRRLPQEMMVWCIASMALDRKEPLHQIVNRLDIMLQGSRPFVAPSAVIQARWCLGNGGTSERTLAESTELLRIMWNGHENADDSPGRFTGPNPGADVRSCKYGTMGKVTDKKGKGFPESGKGEALEISHSPEKGACQSQPVA